MKIAFDGFISSLGGAEEIIPEHQGVSLGTFSVENQKEKGLERKIKRRKIREGKKRLRGNCIKKRLEQGGLRIQGLMELFV